jgi:predicted HAD superfamily Cof-like phosphohydrolase
MTPEQVSVRQFHIEVAGSPAPLRPEIPPPGVRDLRIKLIREELLELRQGLAVGDIVEVADAIGDLLVVVYGAAVECGLDMEPIFQEVMRTNMAKAGGPIREDGKQMKPEGWTPPDLEPIVRHQIAFGWSGPEGYPDEWDSTPLDTPFKDGDMNRLIYALTADPNDLEHAAQRAIAEIAGIPRD